MRKFLSLVLALAMAMSLVVVNTSAKEFTDNDELNYKEAVDVISEIGVVDGYADGSFNPQGGLTRGAAAKIICNLILGPTTAAELHADTRPFPDVAVDSEFAGYIAYCSQQGIISGYADGEFKAANPLTGYAFMKMLLGALGYSSDIEGYVGENWSIQVAKQAIGIGLNTNLVDEFNGVDYVTREEAALYAFNTLQATLVDYENTITADVNGASVTISNNTAKPVTWSEGRNNDGHIKDDTFVQFAEEYFPDLEREDDRTKFEEPANTWTYDKIEIGTYERTDLIVETYTTGVSGREFYDLLKPGVIDNNDLEVYVDGIYAYGDGTIAAAGGHGAIDRFDEFDLVRSRTDDLGATGDGVLTKVYLDNDKDLITIVSINTYLAQALNDYSEESEYATLKAYTNITTDHKALTSNYNVDVVEVPNVVDVTKDTFYQVNISWKDEDLGAVVVLNDVEVLEDSTISEYSSSDANAGAAYDGKVTDLTTGGEEYDANVKAFYDDEILYRYNESLLTDNTYNVYLDQYGYFLGVDLFEGTKNYVFVTGFDRNTSNLSVKTATATGIFLDGTMKNMEVNVTATDKNIRNATGDNKDLFVEWSTLDYPTVTVNADDTLSYGGATADQQWIDRNKGGNDGIFNLNQWYTYTVNEDGVYTLKPATRMTWTQYPVDPDGDDVVIRTDNLSVADDHPDGVTVPNQTGRVYGEDATVFITVDLDDVDTSAGPRAITDVNGVYTGVQSVDLVVNTDDVQAVDQGQVYTVYDSDGYVIAAVVIGEALGNTGNYAYILSQAKGERLEDGVYYWKFDAILDGVKQTLEVRSNYDDTIDFFRRGMVVELRFDGDYVVSAEEVDLIDMYTNYAQQNPAISEYNVYYMSDRESLAADHWRVGSYDAVNYAPYAGDPEIVSLQGHTLYITADRSDLGLGVLRDEAKAVVIQRENGKEVINSYNDVQSAIDRLADADSSTTSLKDYNGVIMAVLNARGAAEWVVFDSDTELRTGSSGGQQGGGQYVAGVSNLGGGNFEVTYYDGDDSWTDAEIHDYVIRQMETYTGMTVKSYSYPVSNTMVFNDGTTWGANAKVAPVQQVALKLDGKVLDYYDASTLHSTTTISSADLQKYLPDGNYIPAGENDLTTGDSKVVAVVGGSTTDTITLADEDYELVPAYTVRETGGLSMTLADGTPVTAGNLFADGTALVVTGVGTDSTKKYQLAEDGVAYGSPAANTGVALEYNYTVSKDVTLSEEIYVDVTTPGEAGGEDRPEFGNAYRAAGIEITTEGKTTTIGGYDAASLANINNTALLDAMIHNVGGKDYAFVGVTFKSPVVNGADAVSCRVRTTAANAVPGAWGSSITDAPGADYDGGVYHHWFAVAEVSGSVGSRTVGTLSGDQSWTVEIEWTFAGGGTVVETYTVVRDAPNA